MYSHSSTASAGFQLSNRCVAKPHCRQQKIDGPCYICHYRVGGLVNVHKAAFSIDWMVCQYCLQPMVAGESIPKFETISVNFFSATMRHISLISENIQGAGDRDAPGTKGSPISQPVSIAYKIFCRCISMRVQVIEAIVFPFIHSARAV